jgi:hypothetical protein
MSTGKNWRAAALVAGFGLAFFFTGCGGGGTDSSTFAPGTLEARSYDFSPNTGGQTAVSFTSPTAYTFQHENGAVEQGTYQAARDGNLWSVVLSSTTGGQQIYNMTFNNESSGTFVLKREGEDDRFGNFTARGTTIATDGGASTTGDTGTTSGSTTTASTTGTTAGSTTNGSSTTGSTTTSSTTGSTTTSSTTGATTTGATTTGSTTGTTTTGTTTTGSTTGSTTGGTTNPPIGYNGFAPTSIAGRVMEGTRTFTSTGTSGQTHTYTFGNGSFHDSDSPEESDGTFVYHGGKSTATLNLTYTGPVTFAGDTQQWTLNFTAKDRGTFQSTYNRGDGTTITINGTFAFQPLP